MITCKFCQASLQETATVCPDCGAFTNIQWEEQIHRLAAAIAQRDPQTKTLYVTLQQTIPVAYHPQLQARLQEVIGSPDTAKLTTAVTTTTTPIAKRPSPPSGKGNQAVFLDFNQKPGEIATFMAHTRDTARTYQQDRRRQRLFLLALFPLGLIFTCADVVMGYNIFTFTLVTLALWGLGIVGLILTARQGRVPTFPARYDVVQTFFDVLKDDVAPKRTLMGWLDLTGAVQESKAYRNKKTASGRPVVYYRDEWLRLKMQLYDGNVLRVTLMDKVKDRKGFYKTSRISRKQKWKSGSSYTTQYLKVSLTADPAVYTIEPFSREQINAPQTRFQIKEAHVHNNQLTLTAALPGGEAFDNWDILHVLRHSYNQLKPI